MTSTPESPRTRSAVAWRQPIYRVFHGQDAHEVRIELPGVAKSGVSIHLEDRLLTVQAQRTANVPSTWKALHREIPVENYQLRLRLNTPMDAGLLEARLEHGVLALRLPVHDAVKPRQIEVQ